MIHNNLTKLKDSIRPKVIAALDEMRADKILADSGVTGIMVSETLRELPTQMAYFARGRMNPDDTKAMYKAAGLYEIGTEEAKRTATWTLESKHLRGEAIDLVPTREGKLWWNAPVEIWARMGIIGESHGLTWGGRWKNRDTPHFEV